MELSCVAGRKTKLLSILRRELRMSDGLVRRLKPQNPFQVNERPAHTNQPIFPGDRITVSLTEPPPAFAPEPGPLSILYEDQALLVVDKPPGLLVHPSPSRISGTLANRVLGYYRQTGQSCAVHVLTRLDRDTMGVVVFGKNAYVQALLVQALQAGQVEKRYYALVQGCPHPPQGEIDLPIGRCPGTSLLRQVDPAGKPAKTLYRVLQANASTAFVELRPLTGRTHQLRVHCQAIGCPIVGDPQYGGGQGGQRLCAGFIRLPHPLTGQPLTFTSRQIEAVEE